MSAIPASGPHGEPMRIRVVSAPGDGVHGAWLRVLDADTGRELAYRSVKYEVSPESVGKLTVELHVDEHDLDLTVEGPADFGRGSAPRAGRVGACDLCDEPAVLVVADGLGGWNRSCPRHAPVEA